MIDATLNIPTGNSPWESYPRPSGHLRRTSPQALHPAGEMDPGKMIETAQSVPAKALYEEPGHRVNQNALFRSNKCIQSRADDADRRALWLRVIVRFSQIPRPMGDSKQRQDWIKGSGEGVSREDVALAFAPLIPSSSGALSAPVSPSP